MRNFVLILVGLLFFLPGCATKPPADPNIGKAGDELLVESNYYEFAMVWKNLGEAEIKEAAHQNPEIQDSKSRGILFTPDNGSKVKVLKFEGKHERSALRKVEILEGDFKGKQGYVPYTVLRESK